MFSDTNTPDSLSFLTLDDLLRASRQIESQFTTAEGDKSMLVVRLLAVNKELSTRTEHLQRTAVEMSQVMEEFEADELADGRIAKAIKLFDEGRY